MHAYVFCDRMKMGEQQAAGRMLWSRGFGNEGNMSQCGGCRVWTEGRKGLVNNLEFYIYIYLFFFYSSTALKID